jgi:zinc/manganese transport system substrate-binding protein
MLMRIIIVLGVVAGFAGAGSARARSNSGPLPVVAAENVYGNIVQQIGGSHVSVTSVLSDPNADPHLFEPGTRNGLAVSQARLVIQNGLGYDAFMDKLEQAAPSSHRLVVTIADALGIHGADANPHLWYDVPKLNVVAGAITAGLVKADPAHASAYRAGRARFIKSLQPLRQLVAQVDKRFKGAAVAYTEPVPGYLIAAAGLTNRAPQAFTRAVEDGTEPTPQAVATMDALVTSHKIKVLLYNSQTVTPVTERVRTAALHAGIPVVGVTETLPPHRTFQQWQLAQTRALYRALST